MNSPLVTDTQLAPLCMCCRLASENHTLKRNMGVYIAEAQRAKTTLHHSLQSRVAMASQAGRTQHESAYDSPQPYQMSQHESTSDLPQTSQMSQHEPRYASYGRARHGQPSECQPAETHAQETQQHEPAVSQGHRSTDQCYNPAAENQQGLSGAPWVEEGSQQDQRRRTPQLAFQLQGATHHSTDAKPHTDSAEGLQHDPCKQTAAEPCQAPEADYKPESDSHSHLQLNGQPMSHVQQALSQVFEACQDQHMAGSDWADFRQAEEDKGNGAGAGNFRGVASPNAARLAFAR